MHRFGKVKWGPGEPRALTSPENWKKPLQWNKRAEANGIRERVFCASLADVFDNEVPQEWRERLWNLITATPQLDWLLLTKRIGNAADMLPRNRDGMKNVWLGISVVNQLEADRDIPKLLATPANIRFLSMEPLLGAIDLTNLHLAYLPEMFGIPQRDCFYNALTGIGRMDRGGGVIEVATDEQQGNGIDWVIVGGESGSGARPMHPDWARSLRDQCVTAGVAFHFKQWGEWQVVYDRDADDPDWRSCPNPEGNGERYVNLAGGHGFHGDRVCFARRVGKKAAGRLLDGREWSEFPVKEVA